MSKDTNKNPFKSSLIAPSDGKKVSESTASVWAASSKPLQFGGAGDGGGAPTSALVSDAIDKPKPNSSTTSGSGTGGSGGGGGVKLKPSTFSVPSSSGAAKSVPLKAASFSFPSAPASKSTSKPPSSTSTSGTSKRTASAAAAAAAADPSDSDGLARKRTKVFGAGTSVLGAEAAQLSEAEKVVAPTALNRKSFAEAAAKTSAFGRNSSANSLATFSAVSSTDTLHSSAGDSDTRDATTKEQNTSDASQNGKTSSAGQKGSDEKKKTVQPLFSKAPQQQASTSASASASSNVGAANLDDDGDKTLLRVKATLHVLDAEAKRWRERGTGPLSVNQSLENSTRHRLVMRQERVLRVILNVSIFSSMPLSRVSDTRIQLMSKEGDAMRTFRLTLVSVADTDRLYQKLQNLRN